MSRGKRVRVAKGIYRDNYGLAAVVTVGRVNREQRFPLDAPLEDLQAWQDKARGELLLDKPNRGAITRRKDPFTSSVARYLKLIEGRVGYAADKSHLAAWVEQFGDRPRASITAEDIRLAFAAWRACGQRRVGQTVARPVSPQTLRHRYRVLKRLYRVLDGAKTLTPLDEVARPAVPRTVPRDVSAARIRAVARKLASVDPVAHARFVVLATTGKAPAELMRTTKSEVDLRAKTWRLHPAKGRLPQTLPLGPEMVEAWKLFIAADAWGEYDTSRQARILRACGWPKDVRPYNVRHALAIELLRQGADLSDIQAHLGHASMETTRRHYAGILATRAKATSQLLNGRLGITAKKAR